ncbi:BLUF domain-containing protein [Iodobacter fluviatilis]|uniref:Blue light sensor protein n=1 Tax=Iodobacter fluviatilis TaxID=537 RepID=A0A7G3G909_9NEIS|nr:BLUF domain-containing protein [Iodobacter fluviatilis]QBC43771.1 blue light sensor protein [Iodobacter fluviatilis]
MIRLLYVSQAASGITEEQVKDILKSAQRQNPTTGLTGVLVHGGGLFMQVLEGPEQAVLRQYVKIMDDRRHSDCQILHISPANDRIFEKWSMGIIQSDPMQFQHIAELRARRLEAVLTKTFTETMREFARTLLLGSNLPLQ